VPLVLDLLRHGAALPAAHGGDASRRLSPRGRADLERLAVHLAGMGWRPDRAFTSPLVRARDSAVIALRQAAPTVVAEVMDALRPEGDPAAVLEALAAEGSTEGHVFLVGHQPMLGLLGGLLIGGPAPGFAPGSLMRIEFTGTLAPGEGATGWRLAPGIAGLNAGEAR
jgi:phosphohistidine phosphatase SixA